MTNLVAIAISAFHSDAAVIDLLEAIFADPHPEVGAVIVVDSLGSGSIANTADERGWPIRYQNAKINLGSAGNLARRLELAAATGAEWCLCMNHDANWAVDRLSAMLTVARTHNRVGAVYPMLDHSPREPRWEDGRKHFRPSAGQRFSTIPKGLPAGDVLWSSSNCALYATAPLGEGVTVMADLWMGYEDLAYGIALHQDGWQQLSCRSALLSKVFDYGPRQFLGRTLHIPEKPAWYSYYNIRNLILIHRRYGSKGIPRSSIWNKLAQSSLRILLLEDNKFMRLRLLYEGALAGLFGQSGKGPLP